MLTDQAEKNPFVLFLHKTGAVGQALITPPLSPPPLFMFKPFKLTKSHTAPNVLIVMKQRGSNWVWL